MTIQKELFARGAWLVFHLSLLDKNILIETECAIFVSLVKVLLSKALTIRYLFIFTVANVLPCSGRKTSPRASS